MYIFVKRNVTQSVILDSYFIEFSAHSYIHYSDMTIPTPISPTSPSIPATQPETATSTTSSTGMMLP